LVRKNSMNIDTLYYDGESPICIAEICKLEKYTQDKLIVRNIRSLDDDDESMPDKALLLSRLHLKTAEGEWITGLQSNIKA
jgi:hypothetical protein